MFPPGRSELEREIEDLRVQLGRISVSSEVEELKKSIERKEREKTQLAFQVEVCGFDIVLCKCSTGSISSLVSFHFFKMVSLKCSERGGIEELCLCPRAQIAQFRHYRGTRITAPGLCLYMCVYIH